MTTSAKTSSSEAATKGTGLVLLVLAAGQFLMTLDSSVMNVSIATVAKDVGTTVTGIQAAITFYTLVMATLMITGGKLGQILGRKRVFAIGCVIYGCGSFTTSLAPNLGVLVFGWSFLEGMRQDAAHSSARAGVTARGRCSRGFSAWEARWLGRPPSGSGFRRRHGRAGSPRTWRAAAGR